MMNTGNKFMRHEAGTHRFRYLRHPSRLAFFAMEAQKPDNGAHLSGNLRKNFPKCELPHTPGPVADQRCRACRLAAMWEYRLKVS
jgi:hypothetical protein